MILITLIVIAIIRLVDKIAHTRKMMAVRDKKDVSAAFLDIFTTFINMTIIVVIVANQSFWLIAIWSVLGGIGTFLAMRSKQWFSKKKFDNH